MNEKKFTDKTLQITVGNLLRYGVWTSLAVGAFGGILHLLRHGKEIVHYEHYNETDKSIGQLFREMMSGLQNGSAQSIIFLGVIILFLTPALRLVLSLFSFLIEKDYLYVFITLTVIAILGCSIALGYSH